MPTTRRTKCPSCGGPKVPQAARCGLCYAAESRAINAKARRTHGDGLMLRPVRYKIDVLNITAVREIGEGDQDARPHLGGHLRKPPPFVWAWRPDEEQQVLTDTPTV